MNAAAGRDVTLRLLGPGEPPVRAGINPQQVVSVLFETDIDTWRRGWLGPTDRTPAQEGIVMASDTTRSVSAASPAGTHVIPRERLAYTLLDGPQAAAPVIEAVRDLLVRTGTVASTVFVDDLAAADMDRSERLTLLIDLLTLVSDSGGAVVIGCSPERAGGALVDQLLQKANRVRVTDYRWVERVERLRRSDPTTYGYVRQHWAEAAQGIQACGRNYPQAKQVHSSLVDPRTNSRTLGMTLSGLASLSVLGTWNDTVGPTRYDLTAYDPAALTHTGVAFSLVSGQVHAER